MMLVILLQGVPWAGSRRLSYFVIVLLAILALIAITMMILKYLDIAKSINRSRQYAPELASLLKDLNHNGATALCESHAKESHILAVVLEGLLEFNSLQGDLANTQVIKHVQQAMERKTMLLQADFERGFGRLDAIGRTAPFIGALGGTPVTFAFGILLAAPTVWFTSTIRTGVSTRLAVEMKHAASEITTYLEKNYASLTNIPDGE